MESPRGAGPSHVVASASHGNGTESWRGRRYRLGKDVCCYQICCTFTHTMEKFQRFPLVILCEMLDETRQQLSNQWCEKLIVVISQSLFALGFFPLMGTGCWRKRFRLSTLKAQKDDSKILIKVSRATNSEEFSCSHRLQCVLNVSWLQLEAEVSGKQNMRLRILRTVHKHTNRNRGHISRLRYVHSRMANFKRFSSGVNLETAVQHWGLYLPLTFLYGKNTSREIPKNSIFNNSISILFQM